jgi:hypothetical protein
MRVTKRELATQTRDRKALEQRIKQMQAWGRPVSEALLTRLQRAQGVEALMVIERRGRGL